VNRFDGMIEGLKKFNFAFLIIAMLFGIIGIVAVATPVTLFGQQSVVPQSSGNSAGWAFLAAGLSISVSVLGAGIALSRIGAAAMAALAEKPEIMGSAIVFAGLAEGLSIWGLIVAVLILIKV
jgi:V/A-type H+-transporting ATPase subunit K